MTLQTQLVLRALLLRPDGELYGLEVCAETGLPSGTVYPIMARLEQVEWVESRWEDPNEHITQNRPRRRYYQLTHDGAEQARVALARVHRPSRMLGLGLPGELA